MTADRGTGGGGAPCAERRASRLVTALVAATASASAPPLLLGPTSAALRASALAGVAVAVLAVGLLAVRSDRRLAALDAIALGDETLPLPPVERVRRQLLDPAWQAALAAGLQVRALQAIAPLRTHPGALRIGDRPVPAGAALGLGELATLLRAARPRSARAVARAELLLVDGARSPLHGRDADALQEEIASIAALLAAEV